MGLGKALFSMFSTLDDVVGLFLLHFPLGPPLSMNEFCPARSAPSCWLSSVSIRPKPETPAGLKHSPSRNGRPVSKGPCFSQPFFKLGIAFFSQNIFIAPNGWLDASYCEHMVVRHS